MLPPGARPSGPGADPRSSQPTHDAAKESNLPSRGLPGPASFEDRMGHQARAAPRVMLRERSGLAGGVGQAVLDRSLDGRVQRVQPE